MTDSPFFIPADDRPDIVAPLLTPGTAPSMSGCSESSGKEGSKDGKDGSKDVEMMSLGQRGAVGQHPLV